MRIDDKKLMELPLFFSTLEVKKWFIIDCIKGELKVRYLNVKAKLPKANIPIVKMLLGEVWSSYMHQMYQYLNKMEFVDHFLRFLLLDQKGERGFVFFRDKVFYRGSKDYSDVLWCLPLKVKVYPDIYKEDTLKLKGKSPYTELEDGTRVLDFESSYCGYEEEEIDKYKDPFWGSYLVPYPVQMTKELLDKFIEPYIEWEKKAYNELLDVSNNYKILTWLRDNPFPILDYTFVAEKKEWLFSMIEKVEYDSYFGPYFMVQHKDIFFTGKKKYLIPFSNQVREKLEKKIVSEELDFIDSYKISSLTYNECFFYYYLYGNELERDWLIKEYFTYQFPIRYYVWKIASEHEKWLQTDEGRRSKNFYRVEFAKDPRWVRGSVPLDFLLYFYQKDPSCMEDYMWWFMIYQVLLNLGHNLDKGVLDEDSGLRYGEMFYAEYFYDKVVLDTYKALRRKLKKVYFKRYGGSCYHIRTNLSDQPGDIFYVHEDTGTLEPYDYCKSPYNFVKRRYYLHDRSLGESFPFPFPYLREGAAWFICKGYIKEKKNVQELLKEWEEENEKRRWKKKNVDEE